MNGKSRYGTIGGCIETAVVTSALEALKEGNCGLLEYAVDDEEKAGSRHEMQSQACTRRYIVVGSKNSVQTAFNTLIKEGVCEDRLKRVYSPIGLDIGSEIVREIATG